MVVVICLFLLTNIFSFSLNSDTLSDITMLYNYRKELSDLATPCTYRFPCKNKPCPDKSCDKFYLLFHNFKEKHIEEWRLKEKELWDIFFGMAFIQRRDRFKNIKGILPNHPVLTEILIKATSYKDVNIQSKAFFVLANGTPFKLLNNYGTLLEKQLQFSTLPDTAKEKLLALSTQSDSVKNVLLSSKTLPLPLRARLGDTLSEKKLFEKFESDTVFTEIEKTVHGIAMAGTPRSLAFLIENFNKPIFLKKDSCIVKSIKLAIIEGFQRHHPDIDLFNELYFKMKGADFYSRKEISTPDSVKAYLKNVTDFFYKTYNVKPFDPEPFPTLIGTPDCRPKPKFVK